jgi:putative heme-binding domain-containing protein
LARLGGIDTQPAILKALAAFPFAKLSQSQAFAKLRVIQVSIARQGVPTGEIANLVISELDPIYPAKTEFANREMCTILLALNAPNAVTKTVGLLQAAATQEEQVSYAMALRSIKTGWTPTTQRAYLSWFNAARAKQHPEHVVQWFTDAGINFNNGSSFQGFLKKAQEEATAWIAPADLAALGDLSKPAPAAQAPVEPRKFVKEYTTAELLPMLDKVSKGRDFTKGKAAFTAAQCMVCHRYGEEGGAVAPDLTAVASRFKRQDILESITQPSKVVSEQYVSTIFKLNNGGIVAGRITQENADQVVVAPNPFDPGTVAVKKADIKERELAKFSIMPAGLLNTLSTDEILDLVAYLESMGDPKHPNFAK